MWHNVAIHCVGCVCAPVRESFCLLWRETQRKGLISRSPARLEVDEDRKVPEKTEGQLAKEDGERQLTTVSRRRQRRWKQGRQRSQQKSERRLLRSDDLQKVRVNQREKISAWLVAFVEVSRKKHATNSLQMQGECKVSQNTLSCAWSWPKFSVVFFCGRHEMCDAPVGNYLTNHWSWIVLV